MRDMQAALGARNAHIHQPALFFDLHRVLRFAVRQQTLLDADQEDVLVFEALGRVQRGQLDTIEIRLTLVEQVDQRDGLSEVDQRLLVLIPLLGQPGSEFLNVLPLRLGGARFLVVVEPCLVADGGQQVG